MFRPCKIVLARVSLDSRYAEEALRGIAKLGIGHPVESDTLSEHSGGGELIDRCFRLQQNTETLLGFIRFHNPGGSGRKKAERLFSCECKEDFFKSAFKERIDYLEECLADVVKIWGFGVDEMISLLAKDIIMLTNPDLAKKADEAGMKPPWLGSSSSFYTVSGFVDHLVLSRLDSLLEDLTDGAYLLLTQEIKLGTTRGVIATVVTFSEYREDIERYIGLISCNNPSLVGEAESQLLLLDELLRNELDFASKMDKYMGTIAPLLGEKEGRCYIDLWVPEGDMQRFRTDLKKTTHGTLEIQVKAPTPKDEVPIKLSNPRLVRNFESVLRMYGLPDYGEIDPTLFIAISMPFFFGLMFGDIGHGLLVALAGLGFRILSKNKTYQSLGSIGFACGLASIFAGFVYGSFFGRYDIVSPLWHRPEIDLGFMAIVLSLGVLHMSFGLLLVFINEYSAKNKKRINKMVHVLNAASQLLLFSGFMLIFSMKTLNIRPEIAFSLALPSFLIPILSIPIAHTLPALSSGRIRMVIDELLLGVSEFFHIFMSTLSNTISYLRILILAFIHEISSDLVIYLSEMVSETPLVGQLFSYAILIVGTLVILAEGFIVFIQSIRLHYYEFFSKFYRDGGVKYEPLLLEE